MKGRRNRASPRREVVSLRLRDPADPRRSRLHRPSGRAARGHGGSGAQHSSGRGGQRVPLGPSAAGAALLQAVLPACPGRGSPKGRAVPRRGGGEPGLSGAAHCCRLAPECPRWPERSGERNALPRPSLAAHPGVRPRVRSGALGFFLRTQRGLLRGIAPWVGDTATPLGFSSELGAGAAAARTAICRQPLLREDFLFHICFSLHLCSISTPPFLPPPPFFF